VSYCGARVGEYLPTGQVGVHACGGDSHKFLMLGARKLELHNCDRDGCGIVWFDQAAPPTAGQLDYARRIEALMTRILENMDSGRRRRRAPARRRKRRA